MNAAHHRRLEAMYRSAPVNQLYLPTLRVADGAAEVSIAVDPRFFHAAGALHGSVYFKLLDDACFFAASSLVEGTFLVTTSFTTYLTRPVTEGQLISRAKVVHAGRELWVAEAVLAGADGREVGRGSGTFMKSRIPLGPEVGYADSGS
jgi:uncharacterized protein (TIGR00369 family)